MRANWKAWAVAAGVVTMGVGGVRAADVPALFQVTATVRSICRVSAGSIGFGSYDPLGVHEATPLDAETQIVVTCTRAISGAVTLQPTSGTPASAFLSSDLDQLEYSLFENLERTVVWDGYSTGGGRKRTFTVPVYGRIAGAQDVASGDYADTVTARLDF